jgi:CHAD domain-containing protein
MSVNLERLQNSVDTVSRYLQKNSKRPSSNAIHKLRTNTRVLEAAFITLGMSSRRRVKQLLRGLRKVRQNAGKVRDMDVLTAKALTVRVEKEQDCLVQLLEYLGARRARSVMRLRRLIDKVQPELRQELQRWSRRMDKILKEAGKAQTVAPKTLARTIQLSSELNRPVRLTRRNLHAYRIHVKELRSVLQLSDETAHMKFAAKLGEVKDAIGEWHDWDELTGIATNLLSHGKSCRVMKYLKRRRDSKYEHAQEVVGELRRRYLRSRRMNRAPQSPDSQTVA